MNELSPKANALIETVGVADGPSAGDRERIRASLFAKIAAGATIGGSATAYGAQAAAASAGLAGAAAKTELVAGALALTGKGGTAAVALWFVAGGAAGVAVATPVALYTERSESAVAPSSVAAHAPAYSGAEPQPGRAAGASPNDIGSRATIRPATEATAPTRPAIAPPPAIARTEHAVAPTEHPIAPPPSDNATTANADVAIEVALLKSAQRELASSNPAASLALLDRHAERYPDGALKAERLGARVFALCTLGRVEQARAAAREFLRVAADSPLVPRVLSSCAGGGSAAAGQASPGGKTETPR
jgi:hypothetical protein